MRSSKYSNINIAMLDVLIYYTLLQFQCNSFKIFQLLACICAVRAKHVY